MLVVMAVTGLTVWVSAVYTASFLCATLATTLWLSVVKRQRPPDAPAEAARVYSVYAWRCKLVAGATSAAFGAWVLAGIWPALKGGA